MTILLRLSIVLPPVSTRYEGGENDANPGNTRPAAVVHDGAHALGAVSPAMASAGHRAQSGSHLSLSVVAQYGNPELGRWFRDGHQPRDLCRRNLRLPR